MTKNVQQSNYVFDYFHDIQENISSVPIKSVIATIVILGLFLLSCKTNKKQQTTQSNALGISNFILSEKKEELYKNASEKEAYIRQKIQKIQKRIPREAEQITWIHGTHSAMLPIAFRAENSPPSLTPAGHLLQENIVPFSGELTFGITSQNGVNREHLSGVDPSNINTAIDYALKGPCDPCDSFEFIMNKNLKTISTLKPIFLKILILRILMDPDRSEEDVCLIRNKLTESLDFQLQKIADLKQQLLELKNSLETSFQGENNKRSLEEEAQFYASQRKEFAAIQHLCDIVKPMELTDLEKKFIHEPFPILWASNTLKSFTKVRSDVPEIAVRGSQAIGADKNIQFAFTTKKASNTLQEFFKKKHINVKVLTLNDARYLQAIATTKQRPIPILKSLSFNPGQHKPKIS